MLVIVSDLHLGDGTCAKSIPPSAFYLFADRLREMAFHASWRSDNKYRPIEQIDLVLLGDILDPQHSTRWLDTAPGDFNYIRPWSNPNHHAYAAKLREVTRAMLAHNDEGLSVLRRCAEGTLIHIPPGDALGRPDLQSAERIHLPVRIYYMVGNHDWHYGLPGPEFDQIRQEIIESMGLVNPASTFPWEPEEFEPLEELFARYQAYARHGDKFDKFNYDPLRGRSSAALGDVFAMEMLNRYPLEVSRQLGPDLPMPIVDSLRKLTNVRPALATPLWIRGQIRQYTQNHALENELKHIWDRLGDEFLAVDFVREADKAFQFDVVDAMEIILHISKRTSMKTLSEVAAWVKKQMWGGAISYTRFALQEAALEKSAARFIAYGHTHHHEVIPLDSDGIPPTTAYQIYFNTGSWHSYYTLAARDPNAQKFVPYQMLTYAIFYHNDERGGRHFESWSGAFA